MKIALLGEKYTPDIGGLAISTGRLGQLLSSAGHQVHVFAPSPGLPASEKRTLLDGAVSVTRFGARRRLDDTLVDWFELLVEEHGRGPFEVLHAYFLPQAGFVATYTGRYLGIPSVVSIRGNDVERAAFDPSKFSHVMYALRNAGAVTTNAAGLAKKARAFFEREVFLIPNGVDTEHFRPMEKNLALAETQGLFASRELGPQGSKNASALPVIGFVGELREKKGLAALLGGYAQACGNRPSTLLIVGEVRAGEDRKIFDEFRLSDPDCKIIVTGHVPHRDLPAYYSLIDVFVHPSLRDGLPNALLEAMSCEKAVIASAVGGMQDTIENGKNGLLLHVNEASALADAILELLDNPDERLALGKAARATILNRFTPEKELAANLNVYRMIGLTF